MDQIGNEEYDLELLKNLKNSKHFNAINVNIDYLKYSKYFGIEFTPVSKILNKWNAYLFKNSIKNVFKNDLRLQNVYEMLNYHEPSLMIKLDDANRYRVIKLPLIFNASF